MYDIEPDCNSRRNPQPAIALALLTGAALPKGGGRGILDLPVNDHPIHHGGEDLGF